jgi:hypothetical protein
MGWLDWVKLIGGGVAAPFTGGATLPIAMSGLGGVLGGAGAADTVQGNESDRLKIALENAKLNRDKFALGAPATRLAGGISGSVASNFQPTKVNWGPGGFTPGIGKSGPPTITGGGAGALANLSPDARQLANQVTHDELVSQMSGGASAPGGGTDRALPTGIGEGSTTGKVLGGLGLGSSILAALLKAKQAGGGGSITDQPYTVPGMTQPWDQTGIG